MHILRLTSTITTHTKPVRVTSKHTNQSLQKSKFMPQAVTLEQVLELAKQLSLVDKINLIEKVTPEIKRELHIKPKPRRSLRGLWRGANISDEDIAEVRQEMSANFPRESI